MAIDFKPCPEKDLFHQEFRESPSSGGDIGGTRGVPGFLSLGSRFGHSRLFPASAGFGGSELFDQGGGRCRQALQRGDLDSGVSDVVVQDLTL